MKIPQASEMEVRRAIAVTLLCLVVVQSANVLVLMLMLAQLRMGVCP